MNRMRYASWIVSVFFVMFLMGQKPHKGQRLFLDGVVSSVDGKVITQSELWGQGYLMLLQRGGKSALIKKIDEEYLTAVLQFMTMQMLLAEMGQQKYEMIADEGNVEKNYNALLVYLGGKKTALELFYNHHLSPSLVRGFIRRDNMASRALARLRKDNVKKNKGSVENETMTLLDDLIKSHEIVTLRIKIPSATTKIVPRPENGHTKTSSE